MSNLNNFENFDFENFENFPFEKLQKLFNISSDGRNIDVKVIFNDQIMNLIKELENNMADDDTDEKTCPSCGTKLKDIKYMHMVGCEVCYSCFKNEINAYLKSKNLVPKFDKKENVWNDLRESLDIAIRTENYEKAAEIKAEMEKIV